MARRRRPPPKENHERWLISYADLVTLLFAFFVVMFASTQTDHVRARQISQAVEKALKNGSTPPKIAAILGGTTDDIGRGNALLRGPALPKPDAERDSQPTPLAGPEVVVRELRSRLRGELEHGDVELRIEERGIIIGLNSATFFPSGGDTVDEHMEPTLAQVATVLNRLPNQIRLEGHTDSQPIYNERFHDNWELSAARGIAMLHLLNERYHVSRDRLAVVGYADTLALADNATEEGRRRNRRVDIVIVNSVGLRTEPASTPPPHLNPTK
jgi:chemotaxis protein MotB